MGKNPFQKVGNFAKHAGHDMERAAKHVSHDVVKVTKHAEKNVERAAQHSRQAFSVAAGQAIHLEKKFESKVEHDFHKTAHVTQSGLKFAVIQADRVVKEIKPHTQHTISSVENFAKKKRRA